MKGKSSKAAAQRYSLLEEKENATMVVLSDKADYGSFAEPSSSGTLITSGSGSGITHTSANASHQPGNIHSTNANSRPSSVSSESNSFLSSSVRSGESESAGGRNTVNNINNNSRVGSQSLGSSSHVHIGLGLDLGLDLGVNRSVPSIITEQHQEDIDETSGHEGTRNRACSSSSRIRNSSGNNNTYSSSSQPTLRLSPTDTIVVITNSGSGKSLHANGTATQAYSNSSSPMSTNSGDLLYQRQPLLQECENGWMEPDADAELESSIISDGKRGRSATRINIPSDQPVVTSKRYPKEKRKTVIAFLILCCNFVLATLSLALTHERLPDRTKYGPLPDIVLDNIVPQDWALDVSDILVAISAMSTAVVMLLHKHRWIVFRRAFLILACLYFMRSITMYVTVLPVASYTYHCSPKSNSTSVLEIARRVVQLVSGFGLSINGQHTYCGDYIYSGHTVILVIAFLFIQEYTPRRLVIVHWTSWIVSCLGVLMMMISRGHYTVDILIAYYVATRLFWIYHTLANNPQLKLQNCPNGSSNNFLSRIWWFPLFRYMEGNVGGALPRQYSLPWSSKDHPRPRRSI